MYVHDFTTLCSYLYCSNTTFVGIYFALNYFTKSKFKGLEDVLDEEGALEAEDEVVDLLEGIIERVLEAIRRDAVVGLKVVLKRKTFIVDN